MAWKEAFETASGEAGTSDASLLFYGALATFLLLIMAWVMISAWKDVARSNEKGAMSRFLSCCVRLIVLYTIVLWFFFS